MPGAKKIYLFILIPFCISCRNTNEPQSLKLSDTTAILTLAVNSKYLMDDFNELSQNDKTIYMVKDSTQKDNLWPAKFGNIKVEAINDFNPNRTFLDQGKDPRFTISEPKMIFKNDTLLLSIYSYKFYTEYKYKLLKKASQWKIVENNALMQ